MILRQLSVSPAFPEAKKFVIREMPYYTRARVVLQSRTRFWKTDKISPNWAPPDPRLNELWSMADEVDTKRGILLGGAQPGVSASASLEAFLKLYPGKSADIEQVIVHDWSKDPYAGMCERTAYKPGELSRFWPESPVRSDEFISRALMPRKCRGGKKRPSNQRTGSRTRSAARSPCVKTIISARTEWFAAIGSPRSRGQSWNLSG